MLSTGFAKDKTADQLVMSEAIKMAEQLNIDIRINTGSRELNRRLILITIGHENRPTRNWSWRWAPEVRRIANGQDGRRCHSLGQ